MKDGFLKVGAASPEIRPGDCSYNAKSIINEIADAYREGVRILVFPELCVTGSTCGDMFLHGTLLDAAQDALDSIAGSTMALDMVCVVGLPMRIEGAVCSCAAVIADGRIIGITAKRTLSPEERRYFSAGVASTRFVCAEYPDFGFEVCIGSDLPTTGAGLVLCMSAGPETVGKAEQRRAAVSAISRQQHAAAVLACAGNGESTAGAVYSGHRIIAENGKIIAESALFGNGLTFTDIDLGFIAFERRRCGLCAALCDVTEFSLSPAETRLTRTFSALPFVPQDKEQLAERCETVMAMQANALAKRIKHVHAEKLVIGISGGLDSTLALIACMKAADLCGMQHADIIAVTMPCFGTTSRTKGNAEKLCELLGAALREVNIAEAVKLHFGDIGHDPDIRNAAFENAQARERTQVLMDIANDVNGIVVGTGDLSELALGWCTYGGDQMSMYGVNCGIPKTLMQRIVSHFADRCENAELAAVLRDIVDTPISPELLPDQKTEDSVGPYELHDFFLYHMIRRGSSPKKIFRVACEAFAGTYDSETIKKWLRVFVRRFFSQQFKRSCSPDGVKIGSVSLSPADMHLPSDICGTLWTAEAEEL